MTPVSESYAGALFGAAESLGLVQTVADELRAVNDLLKQCGEYFKNPRVPAEEKAALLREHLADKVDPLTLEFTTLMLQRQYFKHLPAAVERFRRKSEQYSGAVTVSLRIPYEPDSETLEQLRGRLAAAGLIPAASAEKAKFQVSLDEKIIGGFIARSGGYQIDASLNTMLIKLRHQERYGAQ